MTDPGKLALLFFCGIAFFSAGPGAAEPELVVSTLDSPTGSAAGWSMEQMVLPGPPYGTTEQPRYGFTFLTGLPEARVLDSVKIRVKTLQPQADTPITLTLAASLYPANVSLEINGDIVYFPGAIAGRDTAQNPTALTSFVPVRVSTVELSLLAFHPSSPVSLSPNQRYAFIVHIADPQPTTAGISWATSFYTFGTAGPGSIPPQYVQQRLGLHRARQEWLPFWEAMKFDTPKEAYRLHAAVYVRGNDSAPRAPGRLRLMQAAPQFFGSLSVLP